MISEISLIAIVSPAECRLSSLRLSGRRFGDANSAGTALTCDCTLQETKETTTE